MSSIGWRFLIPWSGAELRRRLSELRRLPVNFTVPAREMTPENGWAIEDFTEPVAREPAGPPEPHGPFARLKQALVDYEFSDPGINVAHYDPGVPLEGRTMLLEFHALGFRFLNGVRVTDVRDESDAERTVFGFRYETLQGHFEQGFECFLVAKEHATGRITFTIEDRCRLGDFPGWWFRLGYRLFGHRYRARWRDRAPVRLRRIVASCFGPERALTGAPVIEDRRPGRAAQGPQRTRSQ